MDKKKLKLSISANTKKTINNIEQAKSNPKNSVIIKNNKTFQKKKFFKSTPSGNNFNKPSQNLGFKKGYCPNAEKYYEECISIPIFPSLTKLEQENVIDSLGKIICQWK